MDTLIVVILAGMAVGFSTEFIETLLENLMDVRWVKLYLTLPFAVLFCWLQGVANWDLVVPSLAASFGALSVMKLLNRPINIQQVVSSRMR